MSVRLTVLQFFGGHRTPESNALLHSYLKDADPTVRSEAARYLKQPENVVAN